MGHMPLENLRKPGLPLAGPGLTPVNLPRDGADFTGINPRSVSGKGRAVSDMLGWTTSLSNTRTCLRKSTTRAPSPHSSACCAQHAATSARARRALLQARRYDVARTYFERRLPIRACPNVAKQIRLYLQQL